MSTTIVFVNWTFSSGTSKDILDGTHDHLEVSTIHLGNTKHISVSNNISNTRMVIDELEFTNASTNSEVTDELCLASVITADDIVHIIQEEADEDILRLSGAGEGDINEPISDSYKARVRWLIANLGTAMVASFIIAQFGAAIETMVALAILMPIVASIGGNAGTQTLAVTVRALATNQLTQSNTMRSIWREVRVAMLIGATVAVIAGLGASFVFGNPLLGGVMRGPLAKVLAVVADDAPGQRLQAGDGPQDGGFTGAG